MKKILIISFLYLTYFTNNVFCAEKPYVKSYGLPGKVGDSTDFLRKIIEEFVQIVFAISVFAVIFSGIYFIISAGNEEKITKARTWIIWSLVGVFLASISWGIIIWLNNIQIKF